MFELIKVLIMASVRRNTPSMLYAYAIVGRPGLANMLLPWARAEIFAHERGGACLAPQWFQPLRIGPWIRRERDKRYYLRQITSAGSISGWRRLAILLTAPRVDEAQAATSLPPGSLVVFQGLGDMFAGLQGHRELLYARLQAMVRPEILARVRGQEGDYIGVHVRRGDFRITDGGRFARTGVFETPNTWYLKAIAEARQRLGADMDVRVFSDASPGELADFQRLHRITIMPPAPAIQDLLLLARSQLIVGTGKSTFSMWASFLSGVTTLWPSNLDLQNCGFFFENQLVLPVHTECNSAQPSSCADAQ